MAIQAGGALFPLCWAGRRPKCKSSSSSLHPLCCWYGLCPGPHGYSNMFHSQLYVSLRSLLQLPLVLVMPGGFMSLAWAEGPWGCSDFFGGAGRRP